MSKILGDNLLYRGQQPNFERDQFKTLAEMRAYNKMWLDDGHIAFCLEDKQHYAWNATANEWQLFTPSGVVKAEDTGKIVEGLEPNIVDKMRTLENDHAKFKAEVEEKMAPFEEKLTELSSNLGIIAGKSYLSVTSNPENTIIINISQNMPIYGIDGGYYIVPHGEYTLPNLSCLVLNTTKNIIEIVTADKLIIGHILLAFNDNCTISKGLLSQWYSESHINRSIETVDNDINAINRNIGSAFSKERIDFNVNADLSIDIIYKGTIIIFSADGKQFNIGERNETYNLPINSALVYDIYTKSHSVVSMNNLSDNFLQLSINDRGYISNGLYKCFWDDRIKTNLENRIIESGQNLNSNLENRIKELDIDFNSKINSISIRNLNIRSYDGYMNRLGEIVPSSAIKVDCLATNWIRVKRGDVILYKGFGASSGYSWVLKDVNDVFIENGQIDSTDSYTEITVPSDGVIRFSSYKAQSASYPLVLDVAYKDSIDEKLADLNERISFIEGDGSVSSRINKNLVNVGHSIWWLDSTVYQSNNGIDGEGTPCKGYQTLLQEQFTFDSITKYCQSGRSLGLGNHEPSCIMKVDAPTWKAHNNAIWTIDTITNDFGRDVPLGAQEDFDNNTGYETYYGALRAFKERVSELSPNAIVICSNALYRSDKGNNSIGLTLEDYERALCYAATKSGWYFVDQYRTSINNVNANYTLYDGLHPSNFGFRLAVKPWIEQFRILKSVLSKK